MNETIKQVQLNKVSDIYEDYYYITNDCRIYNGHTNKYLKPTKQYQVSLKTNEGFKQVNIRTLYRLAFGKVFCIDNIEDLEGEQWKEIPATDGIYQVSNKGRVKSYQYHIAKILTPQKRINKRNDYCYYIVDILYTSDLGIKQKKREVIARLVAKAFVPIKECVLDNQVGEKLVVHHKDFDTSNNEANNLIWLTRETHTKLHAAIRTNETKAVND